MNLADRTRYAGSAAIAMLVVGAALAAPSAALATKPAPEHKVTICHATNSDTNPYVVINVDIASSGHLKGGHDTQHEGPIWDPTLKAQKIKWGDIIPAYTYGDFSYPGQNLGPEGQAMLDNGCVTPETTDDEEPSEPSEETVPSGEVEGATGRPDPTPPATDTIDAALASGPAGGDVSLLLVVLAAAALVGGLSVDRARARR